MPMVIHNPGSSCWLTCRTSKPRICITDLLRHLPTAISTPTPNRCAPPARLALSPAQPSQYRPRSPANIARPRHERTCMVRNACCLTYCGRIVCSQR